MRRNYCRSVIWLKEPLPHSLWISLDLHGILAIVWTPAYSVVSICVCWPPKRRVYNITSSSLLHRKYLLLLCCLLKVPQYQLALIDTASVHIVKGISQHIHNRDDVDHIDMWRLGFSTDTIRRNACSCVNRNIKPLLGTSPTMTHIITP